jgi:quercetin dioxygenase-like cupin family protein
MDIPANFKLFPEHDQSHDGQEEVYTALSGRATLVVGGEEHELVPGVWARVGPDEKRKIVTDDEPVSLLAIGGTPGEVYEPPEFTHEGSAARPMVDGAKELLEKEQAAANGDG